VEGSPLRRFIRQGGLASAGPLIFVVRLSLLGGGTSASISQQAVAGGMVLAMVDNDEG